MSELKESHVFSFRLSPEEQSKIKDVQKKLSEKLKVKLSFTAFIKYMVMNGRLK